MAGLGTTTMQPPAGAAPEPMPAGDAPLPDMKGIDPQGEPATPEEQELYETFVNSAMEVLYANGGERVSPQILADLKGQFDPQSVAMFQNAEPPLSNSAQDRIAATAVIVSLVVDAKLGYGVKAREAEAQAQQGPVSAPDQPGAEGETPTSPNYLAVLVHGGTLILETLMEIAEDGGIRGVDLDNATYRAMDLYRVASEAIGNPAFDKEGLTREFDQLRQANDAGEPLSKVLPGLPGGPPLAQEAA